MATCTVHPHGLLWFPRPSSTPLEEKKGLRHAVNMQMAWHGSVVRIPSTSSTVCPSESRSANPAEPGAVPGELPGAVPRLQDSDPTRPGETYTAKQRQPPHAMPRQAGHFHIFVEIRQQAGKEGLVENRGLRF